MKAAERNAGCLGLYIRKSGVLSCEHLSVEVTVAAAKRSYCRMVLLVRPTAGAGELCDEESRIQWKVHGEVEPR